jgi:Ca2+-binding RTX toxin-like protein
MLEQINLYQRVYTKEHTIQFTYGAPFVLPLYYETSDGDANLSGLTLNIHYNARLLRPDTVKDQHPEAITKATYLKDTNNLDADLNTDSILQLLWVSFDSSFPGVPLPALLANISWILAPLTTTGTSTAGIPSAQTTAATVIRYTAPEVADGYSFLQDYTVIDFTPVAPPTPTYTLSADKTSYNEGDTVKVSVQTSDAAVKYLYYTWGGTNIDFSDFTYDGTLYGGVGTLPKYPRFGAVEIVGGVGSFQQTLLKDETTEGIETLDIQLYSDYDKTIPVGNLLKVSVQDTSVTPIVAPPTGELNDYSNDPSTPTPIAWGGTQSPYYAKISNLVGTTSDSTDYLTFKVLPGQRLTSLRLESYASTDSKAFIGLQKGSIVTASASNPSPLLGYTHFGSGQADANVGSDLIGKLGGPLTEGTYSIWIQQLGAKTEYVFSLTLEQQQTVVQPQIVELPKNTAKGTLFSISDATVPVVSVSTVTSPDFINVQAAVTVELTAHTTATHGIGAIARNVGTLTSPGTGQLIHLKGVGKYSFVATAIPEATTTINLEPNKNTAFFLHDAYSAFYEGLTLTPDSSGRKSTQRALNVDTIKMGSAGGTSIVDLTSKDYVTGAVTVYGANQGRSIFWGTSSNDTFISGGGDSVIFGGGGANQLTLGTGKDTIQYRSGANATDKVSGFVLGRDKVELWIGKDQVTIEPRFDLVNGSTVMTWGGNTVEFVGVADLNLSNLLPITRTA